MDVPHFLRNTSSLSDEQVIGQTTLDWRILCPGPLVDQPPLGLTRMRVSLERLPVYMSALSEMVVSYADAASLMLANITPNDEMSHHRVGLAGFTACQGTGGCTDDLGARTAGSLHPLRWDD